ncbi:MAG: hypothetical protein MI974_09465 [Chitinophagales bacterium]|nr:hypothetical protein [Chitinophagales bacterium]
MKASVEISMYPFSPDYEPPILDFINRLKQYEDVEVIVNSMSTQLFGEYDTLMGILQKEVKETFEKEGTTVMAMKLLHISNE